MFVLAAVLVLFPLAYVLLVWLACAERSADQPGLDLAGVLDHIRRQRVFGEAVGSS